MHTTLDYSSDIFYFIETDHAYSAKPEGIINATWGQDLETREIDIFQSESATGFNLYANNGPKIYTANSRNDIGNRVPGILTSSQPFSLVKHVSSISAYGTGLYVFDGKDDLRNLSDANAFSFYIKFVESGRTNKLILYVDNEAATVDISTSTNIISPVVSLGQQDTFTINSTSTESGTMSFNIKSDDLIAGEFNITNNIATIAYPTICGGGLEYFLFFDNTVDPIKQLMFTKSTDRGLTWEDPRVIDNTLIDSYGRKDSIYKDGILYVYTYNDFFFYSYDKGETFIKTALDQRVDGITSDLIVWNVNFDLSLDNTNFIFNQSKDFGKTWETFINLSLASANDFFYSDVAYDPISRNYSFVFADDQSNAYYLTATNNGSTYIRSDNILPGFVKRSASLYDTLHLDLRGTGIGTTEWILTTNGNELPITMFNAPISYKTSSGGITFNAWANLTETTGEVLLGNYFQRNWHINFPEKGTPIFVSAITQASGAFPWPNMIRSTASSRIIFSGSQVLDGDNYAEIDFLGFSNAGKLVPDGIYEWNCKVEDRSGFATKTSGSITIDNTIPSLISNENLTTPIDTLPINTTTVSLLISETNPASGMLYYRITNGQWKIVPMAISSYDTNKYNFTAVIPSQAYNVADVSWKAEIEDSAGNTLVVDNNGLLYSYAKGVFTYVKQSGLLSPTLYDDWTWSYIFTSGFGHLRNV